MQIPGVHMDRHITEEYTACLCTLCKYAVEEIVGMQGPCTGVLLKVCM